MSPLRTQLASIARSRLVHFIVIGGALFAVAPRETGTRDVTIGPERASEALRGARARAGRSLEPNEKESAIAALVDEEVLAREALRLGLGVDDPVVRARLAERMRAAMASTLPVPDITEGELAAEITRRAANAPKRVRLDVHFFRKDRADGARLAEAFAAHGAAAAEDPAPIPNGAWWTEESLRRVAGSELARVAMSTEVGARSAVAMSAWGLYVVVPLEQRQPQPDELHAEAYEALRTQKQAAALARLVERKRAEYRVDLRGADANEALAEKQDR